MNIGTPEILILLAVVLLLFGSTQVPKLARAIGRSQREFKEGLRQSDDQKSQKAEPPPAELSSAGGDEVHEAEVVDVPGESVERNGKGNAGSRTT